MADFNSAYTGAQIDAAIAEAQTAVQPGDLGTAAAADTGDFATSAQGGLADTAVQPGDNANTLGSGAALAGYVLAADGAGAADWVAATGGGGIAAIGYAIDGGGAQITTGLLLAGLRIPFAATIESVTLLADQTGSIVVDIWKDTLASFPPTDADSICASAKPTLSSARTSEDTTLSGWTTSIAAGDVLFFNVDSATDVQNVTIILKVTKT